jgi:uncharacterized protein (DUF983 family)
MRFSWAACAVLGLLLGFTFAVDGDTFFLAIAAVIVVGNLTFLTLSLTHREPAWLTRWHQRPALLSKRSDDYR